MSLQQNYCLNPINKLIMSVLLSTICLCLYSHQQSLYVSTLPTKLLCFSSHQQNYYMSTSHFGKIILSLPPSTKHFMLPQQNYCLYSRLENYHRLHHPSIKVLCVCRTLQQNYYVSTPCSVSASSTKYLCPPTKTCLCIPPPSTCQQDFVSKQINRWAKPQMFRETNNAPD